MKIIFIPNLPYTYRDHQRFGVEYFIKKGYDVDVFDLHKILVPGYKESVPIEYWTFENHYELNDKIEIIEKIKNLTDKDFIFFYLAGKEALLLLEFMKSHTNAKFITYVGGSIPTVDTFCTYIEYTTYNIKKILKKILPKYKIKTFETDYFISGSPVDEKIFPYLIGSKTKLIKSSSRDYNLCLNTKSYISEDKYCLFLDTDVIDASDYILFNENLQNDVEQYKEKLIKFLKWIEIEYDMKVIIAAHPKSRIYKDKTIIEGIKIVHEQSAELSKGCEFVVNEGTTAISYPIFFNKPIVFFTFKEINFFYKHCCKFAKSLDKNIVNIDFLNDFLKTSIDKELTNNNLYIKYKKRYMTYTDDEISTFELINDLFKDK